MNFDFAATIPELHEMLRGHPDIQIIKLIEIGPAGGNPNVTLRCHSRDDVLAVLDWYGGEFE